MLAGRFTCLGATTLCVSVCVCWATPSHRALTGRSLSVLFSLRRTISGRRVLFFPYRRVPTKSDTTPKNSHNSKRKQQHKEKVSCRSGEHRSVNKLLLLSLSPVCIMGVLFFLNYRVRQRRAALLCSAVVALNIRFSARVPTCLPCLPPRWRRCPSAQAPLYTAQPSRENGEEDSNKVDDSQFASNGDQKIRSPATGKDEAHVLRLLTYSNRWRKALCALTPA